MKECPKTCGVCTVTLTLTMGHGDPNPNLALTLAPNPAQVACVDHDPGCKGWASAAGGKLCESEEDKARHLAFPPYPSCLATAP